MSKTGRPRVVNVPFSLTVRLDTQTLKVLERIAAREGCSRAQAFRLCAREIGSTPDCSTPDCVVNDGQTKWAVLKTHAQANYFRGLGYEPVVMRPVAFLFPTVELCDLQAIDQRRCLVQHDGMLKVCRVALLRGARLRLGDREMDPAEQLIVLGIEVDAPMRSH